MRPNDGKHIAKGKGVSEPIWSYVIYAIFAIGALGVLVMTIYPLQKVIGIIAGGEHRTLESGETLVINDAEIAPFSWMKYIVLSREAVAFERLYLLCAIGNVKRFVYFCIPVLKVLYKSKNRGLCYMPPVNED